MKRALLPMLLLAGCADQAPSAPAESGPQWESDIAAFCQARDDRFAMMLVDKVAGALPASFAPSSVALEGMNLQAPFDGRQGVKELQLRLAALRDGDRVPLSAYALVEPGSCGLAEFHVIEGFDRIDPPMRADID